jgi:hypothetical protein
MEKKLFLSVAHLNLQEWSCHPQNIEVVEHIYRTK